jgi:phospholipid/cholesterol/gamma-HCH transport system permease protein
MDQAPAFQIETTPSGDIARLRGAWTLPGFARLQPALDGHRQIATVRRIDLGDIERLDSAGALLVARVLKRNGLDLDALEKASDEQRALIAATRATLDQQVAHARPKHWTDLFERAGHATAVLVDQVRRMLGFIGLVAVRFPSVMVQPARWRLTSIVSHVEQTGVDALPIVALLSFMVGAVITFLGATVLQEFGASVFAVELVSFSFLREFGVLLTAILLAGRTASAFTAQIGAMKAREEIDALRTLGMDPVDILVLPRLLALLVVLPLLTCVAMAAGIIGGLVICATSLDISTAMFLARLQDTFEFRHFLVGVIKAPVFALVIGIVGCLQGFEVGGSAESVGRHTTTSVVQAIFLVIMLDAVFALVFQTLGI